MQNVAGPLDSKTGPLDPPNYAAKVPADQWYGTGKPQAPVADTPVFSAPATQFSQSQGPSSPQAPFASPPSPAQFTDNSHQAAPAQAVPEQPLPAQAAPFQTAPDQFADDPNQPPGAQDDYSDAPEDQYYQDPQTGQYFPGYMKPRPEELVFGWVAPDRPFKQRKKQFFMTASTIAALICMILFFAGQLLPMAVVVAVLFVIYMLYTFPPHQITNQITTYGIRNENNLYYWEELGRFWFEQKLGNETVLIEVSRFPNRLTLVLGEADRATIEAILSEVLLQEKPPLSPVEKAAQWLQDKVPLDLDE